MIDTVFRFGTKDLVKKLALVVSAVMTFGALAPVVASASGILTSSSIRLDRMKTGATTSARIVFTTSSATATEDSVKIDFNGADSTTWTGSTGSVNATQTVSVASCPAATGASALPGSITAAGSGSVVTISSVTNLTASTSYCVDLTSASALTLPSAGEYHPTITTYTSATVDDTTTVAVRVVSDDQVTVNATIPPSFNFVLDSNSTSFSGPLSSGSKVQTTARTVTVNTNATGGWVAWVRNSDATGLFSATAGKNIAGTTPGTNVNVDASLTTEQYVWGVNAVTQGTGAGTTSANAAFDATGTNEGTGVDQTYRTFASSTGTAQNAVVSLRASATISSITPAASDYTDTIQVIGAGFF
jgi:hypothetical protein